MTQGDRARILIVDDNASLRRSLDQILTRAGHEVIQAADGAEASRISHDRAVDLVILDLFMPEKDGIETLRELRARAPGVPIIAISGGTADDTGVDLLKAAVLLGAVRSMEKPFTPAEMLDAVQKALGGRKPGPA
jgi:two-component system, chemotaxis family, chemotaxis protein CheY